MGTCSLLLLVTGLMMGKELDRVKQEPGFGLHCGIPQGTLVRIPSTQKLKTIPTLP
jgi:hypothetical protein